MPGVSSSTIWAAGRWTTPMIRWRVVWALSETMATVRPTSRFTRVDLPTVGRPMTATKPERNSCSCPRGLVAGATCPFHLRPDRHHQDPHLTGQQGRRPAPLLQESRRGGPLVLAPPAFPHRAPGGDEETPLAHQVHVRSEERRVGKEGRPRGPPGR